eukprot:238050-Hanusia_phi.AAC.1
MTSRAGAQAGAEAGAGAGAGAGPDTLVASFFTPRPRANTKRGGREKEERREGLGERRRRRRRSSSSSSPTMMAFLKYIGALEDLSRTRGTHSTEVCLNERVRELGGGDEKRREERGELRRGKVEKLYGIRSRAMAVSKKMQSCDNKMRRGVESKMRCRRSGRRRTEDEEEEGR